jgi:hypothetical protein
MPEGWTPEEDEGVGVGPSTKGGGAPSRKK